MKKIIISLFVFSLAIMLCACGNAEDYNAKLTTIMNDEQQTAVQDVFSFDFEKAYIFDDPYISGEGFAEKYNLDISINQVKSGASENIQRIVFVDKSGAFVYEFKCVASEVFIQEKGLVIYPETVIEKTSSSKEKLLTIAFKSSEYYGSNELASY